MDLVPCCVVENSPCHGKLNDEAVDVVGNVINFVADLIQNRAVFFKVFFAVESLQSMRYEGLVNASSLHEGMEGLGQDNPDPDDDVGGQEVHHAKVGDSFAEVNLESRVGHDNKHLTKLMLNKLV